MTPTSSPAVLETPYAGFSSFDEIAPLKVLLADDHPLVLAGLRRMLDEQEGIEVVGQAHSAAELVALAHRRGPDIVLTDLRMPGVVAFELIEQLRTSLPEVKIVILSASDDRASVNGALLAGASAFVVKTAAPTDVATVLRQVHGGAVFHAPSALHAVPNGADAAEPAADGGPELTARERTILSAIASGLTTSAISKQLWVSEHTVKFHLTNIYRKLGVGNRAGAIRCALDGGLLD
jgi:DNA-binding NarL/FixJ family response regulator